MDAYVGKDGVPAPVRRRRRGRSLLLCGLLLAICGAAAVLYWRPAPTVPAAAIAPPTVTVSAPLVRRLATYTTFTGQFSAMDRVEIRAQVSGYLTEIHFKDGQIVHKGDLLFVIDPRPYEIALQNAHAQVEAADASLNLSKKQLARTSDLLRSDFASRETFDQRTQSQLAAQATLDQAKAAVGSAELNMDWTHIVAPLTGRISAHRVSVGNLIAGGQTGGATTLLTTIVSLDPIYLDFDMSEGDYIAYQRFTHSQAKGGKIDRTVGFALSDESGWTHEGKLDFIDNEMDRSSGTIHARATVPNPDLFIAGGQFARLRVPTTAATDTMLLPDAAVAMDQSRTVVMTVDPGGTVVPKTVETGATVGDLRIIRSGIARDDRVIINGLMFARPGAKVTPKSGAIAAAPDQG